MQIRARIFLAVLALATVHLPAEDQVVNVDELPRRVILLPNGTKCTVIFYGEQNWRLVDPSVLSGDDDSGGDNICFEVKFDGTRPPNKIKLYLLTGTLIIEDKAKFKTTSELKRQDNIWVCGNLKKTRDGKSVEFLVNDFVKLPADLQLFEARILAATRNNDSDALIEFGRHIEDLLRNNQITFPDYDRYIALKDKAYIDGINIKEKALKANDADGYFNVARLWKDLAHKNAKYRELILKSLEIDPDHPKASLAAEQELRLKKFERQWLRQEEIDRILAGRIADKKMLDAQNEFAIKKKQEDREKEAADRAAKLLVIQAALRTNDTNALNGAITTLGEDIQKALDPGFGEEAVDLLVNLNHPLAVAIGLEHASKSELPEVRRAVFEALAWRGAQRDQGAFDILSRMLKNEADKLTAKSGIDALAGVGNRGATQVLIDGLDNPDQGITDSIMDALKIVSHQPLRDKDPWRDWWRKNKDTLPQ